jgi:hypothetical protein
MKLKPMTKIGKHRKWCGPAALSILTGRSVNHCARVIAKRRNRRGWYNGKGTGKQVRGTYITEVSNALGAMGFELIQVGVPHGTLRAYMAGRGGDQWKNAMLIEVTHHWVTAHRDTVADNTGSSHYSEHRWRGKKVVDGWIVKTKRKR